MHPRLQEFLEKAEAHFRADPRCLGLYLFGSVGKGTDDPYSDLDLAVVVRDAAYAGLRQEFRSLCEGLAGPLAAWLPEGEEEQFVNCAFLFEADGELLLGDFSLMTGSFFTGRGERPGRILFDPEGILAAVTESSPRPFPPEKLLPTIAEYWVYAYIYGKYSKRQDLFKLCYLQETLLKIHVRLLRALHPSVDGSWWPVTLRHIPADRQERMKAYFTTADPSVIAAALEGTLDTFSDDARAACHARGVAYPEETEHAVRAHLVRMGLPVAGAD